MSANTMEQPAAAPGDCSKKAGNKRNPVCADLAELRADFAAAVGRLQGKPEALGACLREVDYV